MSNRTIITFIFALLALSVVGIAAYNIYGGITASRTVSYLSDVSTHLDLNDEAANITFRIDEPTYGGTLDFPNLRPFEPVTSFQIKTVGTSEVHYTVNFEADNVMDLTLPNSDFRITQFGRDTVSSDNTNIKLTIDDLSNTVGLEPIFARDNEAYLEQFFEGFIPFRDSLFYHTYKNDSSKISSDGSTIMRRLAEALFESYHYTLSDGEVSLIANPADNSHDIKDDSSITTLVGVTRPDVAHIKNIGKMSNSVSRESVGRLRYVNSLERSPAVIEEVLRQKVFGGTVSSDSEEIFKDLVDLVRQIPTGPFLVPDRSFQTNSETGLPLVRLVQ